MKRRGAMLAAALVVVAGCRGIVGISDLTVVDGGDEGADSGAADAGVDTGLRPDTSPPSDGPGPPQDSGAGSCIDSDAQGGCRSCCHKTHDQASLAWQQAAIASGCLCGDGGCTTLCSTAANGDICANPSSHAAPPCGGCYDGLVVSPTPACAAAASECRQNEDQCGIFVDCMLACQSAGQ